MKILINKQPLDFMLEDESSLGEVADGVSRWLDPAGLVITAGRLAGDGASRSPEEKERWSEVSLEGVDEIDFTVEDFRIMQINHLRTLHEYFELLASNSARRPGGNGVDDADDVIAQLPELLEGLRAILGQRQMTVLGAQLAELQDWLRDTNSSHSDASPLAAHELNEVTDRVAALDAAVVEIERELSDPAGALLKQLAQLEGSSESIDQVAVWLQSGDDRNAMEAVATLTDHTQQVMRSVATLRRLQSAETADAGVADEDRPTASRPEDPVIDGKPESEFYRELNGFLREIAAAFENLDAVLIGDLLEYEVAPRIDSLLGFAAPYAHSR